MAETAAEAAFGGVDKNRDGLIDAEELAEAFEAMDEDGSGTIDIEELGAAMRRLGAPITVEEVAELMAQVDVDGNGFLDVEEFRKAAEAFINAGPGGALPQQADSRGPAQIIFEQIDTDGSGYIDIDELSFALRRMGRAVPATELREVMDSVDLNGDGQLDLEEFTKAGEAFLQRTVNAVDSHIGGQTDSARAIFDKIDVDGSGTIDAQELGFALERMGRQVTQEELITMMQSVDVDGDGQLTFEEFEAMSGEFVARAVYRSVNKKALVRGTLELNSKAVGELDIGEYIEARCKAQALADANESGAVPQPQNDEVPPGTQIHVRGIGVDGWDSTPEGKGSHESESALKAIFEQYGKFLQATIRHRIEGPSGKWDPKTTPAADWPREGSKNSSWALVTMETTSAVDAALEASELEGVYAGAQLLKLTRFSKDVASTSGGAMAAVRELDQNEKKRRATRIQFEAVWSEHGANLGLSGWVSMTASSGEMLLERVPAAEAEVWKSRQKQKLLEHAIAIFRNLSERSDMCTVYKALKKSVIRAGLHGQSEKVGDMRKGRLVAVYGPPCGPQGGVQRVQFDCIWSDMGPDLGKAGWTSTVAASGKTVLQPLSMEERDAFIEASLLKLEEILGRQGVNVKQEAALQAARRAATSWQRRITGKIRVKHRAAAFEDQAVAAAAAAGSARSTVAAGNRTHRLLGVHKSYDVDFGELGASLQEVGVMNEAEAGKPGINELIRELKNTLGTMEFSRQKLLSMATQL